MKFPFAAAVAFATVTGYALWSRTRRRHVNFDIAPDVDRETLMRAVAALTWGRVIEGNAVRVIQDRGFFGSFLEDIRRAAHHVHLETFLWENGYVSDGVVEALTAAARRGIEVRVIVDQRGGEKTSPEVWDVLREAGCDLRIFRRPRFRDFGWYNHRDHRKIVVIDGRTGYTFGHGIADLWDSDSGWRDTAVRIEGPVVGELQTAFFDNWVKVTGRGPISAGYFPRIAPAGSTPIHIAWAALPETASAVQRLYYVAIAAAGREVLVQNPYFLPDRQALRLCADAVARGVDVRVMLPAAEMSDFPIVQHASHYHYGALLDAGATLCEYKRSGMHQKVMVIDREWCIVGSTNFDPRSFGINDEISVAIHDAGIAGELARAFELDARAADRTTLARWSARPLGHRIRDRISVSAKRQL